VDHRPFNPQHSHPKRRSAVDLHRLKGDEAKQERRAGTVGESNGLAHEPKPPAIGFLYEDLAPSLKIPKAVFGQYPRTLIPALLPWLLCERREILHVCSGSLPQGEGVRVDIRPDAHPDIVADGRALPFADGSLAAAMADPPYNRHYAKDLYGVEYPRPSHLLREIARVVRPGGRFAFVHYITPNPPPRCRFVKAFGLSTGFGFPMRAVTVYERRHADLVEVGESRRPAR
jgi:SAM-dependent methyltransferase